MKLQLILSKEKKERTPVFNIQEKNLRSLFSQDAFILWNTMIRIKKNLKKCLKLFWIRNEIPTWKVLRKTLNIINKHPSQYQITNLYIPYYGVGNAVLLIGDITKLRMWKQAHIPEAKNKLIKKNSLHNTQLVHIPQEKNKLKVLYPTWQI